jgi:cellulase/cellobiase CelA1
MFTSIGERPTIVVYGLPNKDCEGHHSSDGSNKTPEDYIAWLEALAAAVGDKPVIYILEPDAIGLLAGGSACATKFQYERNLIHAVTILGRNPNADLYMDIGYWVLNAQNNPKIAAVLSKLDPSNRRLKGISINTSNFRTTEELVRLCHSFAAAFSAAAATDRKEYNHEKDHALLPFSKSNRSVTCVLDVSRNFNGPDANNEWCNPRGRGIGVPPTMEPEQPLIDYFLWIKPPGESDGYCNGGPNAGAFFLEGFVDLWNNGYFVKAKGYSPLQFNVNVTNHHGGASEGKL